MDEKELLGIIEGILFVSGEPIAIKDLAEALDLTDLEIRCVIDKMMDTFNYERRGLQIVEIRGKIQLSTRPEHSEYIDRVLHPIQKQSLSQAVLETLSIIAYCQPITRAEIESIRGVKCDHSISSLLEKGLVEEVGRKDSPGRPFLYGTTDEFLKCFGLSDISDLPDLHKQKGAV